MEWQCSYQLGYNLGSSSSLVLAKSVVLCMGDGFSKFHDQGPKLVAGWLDVPADGFQARLVLYIKKGTSK